MPITCFLGSFIDPISIENVEFIEYGLCLVNEESGEIVQFQNCQDESSLEDAVKQLDSEVSITRLTKSQFFIPGFVDTHTHAPQYRNMGLGLDYPLLEWLEKVTFPEEQNYFKKASESDAEYYQRIADTYSHMVKHYLRCGTTTCCYFGSLQLEANKILVDQVAAVGQRALVGKVCMDCNSPSTYVEETENSIEQTKEFIEYVREVDSRLSVKNTIMPIVTPRFAICCSSDSMKGLGKVASDTQCHIQSHLCENLNEIDYVGQLFPQSENYTQVYGKHGILTDKTIMAHCVHMDDGQLEMLAAHGTGISHCPNSNFALESGIMDIRQALAKGVNVGLGTDVSGGYSPSILDAMRQAIIASKATYFKDQSKRPLKVTEAFYLATMGGAKALNLDNLIGNFGIGKRFDALLVDMNACPIILKEEETLQEFLQRLVFLGDDRWISKVYVNGLCRTL